MSHVQRRCPRCRAAAPRGRTCARCGAADFTYRVRYIDPDGRERSRSFKRRADAEDFETSVRHTLATSTYVDPAAGRITVRQFLAAWLEQQAHLRPKSRTSYETRFRTMVTPHIGDLPIAKVKPSTIRTWQATLLEHYAASTIKVTRGILAGAFADAVLDRLLPASPFTGVKAPDVEHHQVVPRTPAQVRAAHTALAEHKHHKRYAATIPVAAGTGMRAGELLGLTVDRVDFLRKRIRVDRQLVGRVGPDPVFGPPKTKKSRRTIPIAQTTVDALAAHLAAYPAGPGDLVFRTARGTPITRTVWNRGPWKIAAAALGLEPGQGLHQLRHFYASLLIADGRSIKEVQERLGHASAQETLDTYSHLFPDSDDGTRQAIDRALGNDESGAAPKDDAADK